MPQYRIHRVDPHAAQRRRVALAAGQPQFQRDPEHPVARLAERLEVQFAYSRQVATDQQHPGPQQPMPGGQQPTAEAGGRGPVEYRPGHRPLPRVQRHQRGQRGRAVRQQCRASRGLEQVGGLHERGQGRGRAAGHRFADAVGHQRRRRRQQRRWFRRFRGYLGQPARADQPDGRQGGRARPAVQLGAAGELPAVREGRGGDPGGIAAVRRSGREYLVGEAQRAVHVAGEGGGPGPAGDDR